MSGGEGKRLRPITEFIPKPLVKICEKPVLKHILELVKKNNFQEATLTLKHKYYEILNVFEDDEYLGVKLNYSIEENPLGTAGSVKKAVCDDEVLVISGDCLCDFDLTSAIKFHKKNKADATIITKNVCDPRDFGLVLSNESGKILSFAEKPSYENCVTDFANTGVYILSKSILELIPENEKSDFAKDIFPKALKNGLKLFSYQEKGYWCDIGTIKSYLQCHKDVLSNNIDAQISSNISKNNSFSGVKIFPPVYIGENVTIGSGSIIYKNSVICDNVSIGENAIISGAIIKNGAFLANNTSATECVICEGVTLLQGSLVEENAVIGERSQIGENSAVCKGVRVIGEKNIPQNLRIKEDVVKSDFEENSSFQGLFLTQNSIPSLLKEAVLLGNALGTLSKCKKIALGYTDDNFSKTLARVIASGICSSGADVWNFGNSIQSETVFCSLNIGADFTCFVSGNNFAKAKITIDNGLPLTREIERKIEEILNGVEYHKESIKNFGEDKNCSQIKELYLENLKNSVAKQLCGLNVFIRSDEKRIAEIGKLIFSKINDTMGEDLYFSIEKNEVNENHSVTLFNKKTGSVSFEKLLILGCISAFDKNLDIALPFTFPIIAEEIAKKYGKKVHRYYSSSINNIDKYARNIAKNTLFVRDGLALICEIIDYLTRKKIDITEALAIIPDFFTIEKFIGIKNFSPLFIKKILENESNFSKEIKEGAVLEKDKNRVIIKPLKSGKGVRILAQSYKNEIAQELFSKYENIIKSTMGE